MTISYLNRLGRLAILVAIWICFCVRETTFAADQPTATFCSAKVAGGVVNRISIRPSVYDKDGEWLEKVDGGFAIFIVAVQQVSKIPEDISAAIIKEWAREPKKKISELDIPVGLHNPDVLIISIPSKEILVACQFIGGHVILTRIKQVVVGVYQFDAAAEPCLIENESLAIDLAASHHDFEKNREISGK
ncbi:hypothetical protein BH11VER1_BH11VER1_35690 [soil metagenome]